MSAAPPLAAVAAAVAPADPRAGRAARSGWRRPRLRAGTAVRLAALQAVVVGVVLALSVAGLVRIVATQASAATTRAMTAEARSFAAAADARPLGQDLLTFTESYLRGHVFAAGETVVVVLAGRPEVGSAGSAALLASRALSWLTEPPPRRAVARDLWLAGRPVRLLAVPLLGGGRPLGTYVVAADRTRSLADIARVRRLSIGEAAVALLASVAGAYLLLRRLLRRIGRITTTAASIGRGDLDRRLGDQGTDDEVGTLAATFDQMAGKLAAAMSAQRRLLSDVSHQLRTPLTVARGHLEVLDRTAADDPAAVRETVAVVVDELDHMRSLVERLLLLGHALEPDFCDPQPIDLRSFLRDVGDAARVLAERSWPRVAAPDLVLWADPAKLRGALLNLVDNAVRATGPGDTVALTAVRRADGGLDLAVEDSGPGIPPGWRAEAVARFRRPGATDGTGSGLGLAIVAAVAAAHGGTLDIGDSRLGGARLVIRLPAACVLPPGGEVGVPPPAAPVVR